jgi:hypothetical protein
MGSAAFLFSCCHRLKHLSHNGIHIGKMDYSAKWQSLFSVDMVQPPSTRPLSLALRRCLAEPANEKEKRMYTQELLRWSFSAIWGRVGFFRSTQ